MRGGMLWIVSFVLVLAACGGEEKVGPDAGVEIDGRVVDARLASSRPSADFGMVLVGESSLPITFTITNEGSDPSGALTVAVAGSGYRKTADTCQGGPLGPSATCQVSIDVTPAAAGTLAGSLTVSASPGGELVAPLTVEALVPGMLVAVPDAVSFDTVTSGTMSAPRTVTIRNDGDATSGFVMVQLGGPDAAEFELVSNGCMNQVLDGDASCDVGVRMRPAAASTGAKMAMITATAQPGGAAVATLTGTAQQPAVVAINGSGAFGGLLLGTTAERTLMVQNVGEQPTGTLTITRTGNAAFQVLTGMAGDCESTVTTLAPGAMCNVRVQYTAQVPGPVVGTITASAMPGGSAMASLTGTGQRPPMLSGDHTAMFGLVEVMTLSPTTSTWMVTNTGGQPTSVPELVLSSGELVVVNNGCMAAIPAGGSCMITLRFQPAAGGARNATAMLSVVGSSVVAMATATGGHRLTLARNGDAGRVTSSPAGLDCNAPALSCSAVFAPGNVTLQARTTNGSLSYFAGWSGASAGACAGSPYRDCVVTVDGTELVAATFNSMQFNLAFVTSTAQATSLGSAPAYDGVCNQLATAAGINNAAGNGYVAWVSGTGSNAIDRLAPAGGWVRLDGKVMALDRGSLVVTQRIFNAVRFTETGEDAGDAALLSGTLADGTTATAGTCSNWSGSGTAVIGNASGGPTYWGGGQTASCAASYRVLCLGKTNAAGPAAAPASNGKKVWLSNAVYAPGPTANADATCNADRPAGVAMGRALVSRTTASAASLLAAGTMYVRPDGQEVGTGAELIAGAARGGIWQSGAGAYWSGAAWTGSQTIDALGQVTSTCGDWTEAATTGRITIPPISGRFWGSNLPVTGCSNLPADGPRLMCFEP